MPTLSPESREQVTAESSTNLTRVVLPWTLAFGATTMRVVDEMRAKSGSLVQAVEHRFASVDPRQPGAWTVSSTSRSADGIGKQDIDLSGTTDQAWVQVGLVTKATSGVAEALSGIRAQTNCPARVICNRTFEHQAVVNSGESAYWVLADPLPALGLTKLMFVITWSGVGGTVTFRPIWRTIDAHPDTPNAWSDLDSAQSITSDTLYNSGTESTVPGSGEMYFQPGLKVGGPGGRGAAQVLVLGVW